MDTIETPPEKKPIASTRPGAFDMKQWQEERDKLTKKRLQLEERLSIRGFQFLCSLLVSFFLLLFAPFSSLCL